MDVVFEGTLSQSWGMEDVLRAVLGVENIPSAILRISALNSVLNGRLSISQARYITGALVTNTGEQGYEALRKLLSATEGNFALLDGAGKPSTDIEESLYISIERLIPELHSLPDHAALLFDEKSLLDKVFGGEDQGDLAVLSQTRQPTAVGAAAAATAATTIGWKAVDPLLAGVIDNSFGGDIPPEIERELALDELPSHKESLHRLKAQQKNIGPWYSDLIMEMFAGKSAYLWLTLIILLSLVATLFACCGSNIGDWLTMLRGAQGR